MIKAVGVALVVLGVVLLAIVVVVYLSSSRSSAAEIARRRTEARWVVNDTGTDEHGQAIMAIELVNHPAVGDPFGRRVLGTYDVGDDVAWAELHGQAQGLVKGLNDRLDESQNR